MTVMLCVFDNNMLQYVLILSCYYENHQIIRCIRKMPTPSITEMKTKTVINAIDHLQFFLPHDNMSVT